jgi:hypothetical protein
MKRLKMPEAIMVSALLSLSACATLPPQQPRFDRPNASAQDFEIDRYTCIQYSLRTKSGAGTKEYDGSIAKDALPSRAEYTACMIGKNWHMVTEGGFLPKSPTAMTE